MRNLKCVRHSIVEFPDDLPLSATCWDVASNSLLCTFGPSAENATICLRRLWHEPSREDKALTKEPVGVRTQIQELASWDALPPAPDQTRDKVVSLQYFSDNLSAYIILAGGDIIIVREEVAPEQDKIEILGTVDAGIAAARWSPDEEILVICTCADTLLFMTRDLENVADVMMSVQDLDVSNHVSVGWGKSETQFKGKRAKALRDPTMPEHVDEGISSPLDDGKTSISWRGDAAYVAVSAVIPNKRRVIRVYSREGSLDSVSEPVDGLEAGISWRPAGDLIAGIQRLSDRIDVVFFERNGLRHGQFPLRLTQREMSDWASEIDLDWNSHSTSLAVIFKGRAQVWTMGNYHYYLKQEVLFPWNDHGSTAIQTRWHPERSFTLALSSSSKIHFPQRKISTMSCCKVLLITGVDRSTLLEYESMPAAGSMLPPNDLGIVAAIDGNIVKLTPLRIANVPPPLAHHEIQGHSIAMDVAFSRSGALVAVLSNNSLIVYSWDPRTTSSPQHKVICWFEGFVNDRSSGALQVAFVGDSHVFVLASGPSSSTIFSFTLKHPGLLSPRCLHEEPKGVLRLFSRSDHDRICIHRGDNVVAEGEIEREGIRFRDVAAFPAKRAFVEVVDHEGQSIAFGLGVNGLLYGNERVLARNCTSFLTTSAHLIFTTTQHLLKFVHLATVEKLEVPPDDPEENERCRSIERGAKLVAVMPTSFCLTLQMPRGNLETIYPRALVLAGIRRSVKARDYRTAFLACRSQRVDMNIIYDYAPEEFLKSVSLFVDQVKKVEHLDLFLSALRNEVVTMTMYRETTTTHAPTGTNLIGVEETTTDARLPSETSISSKVNRICNAFLEVLTPRSPTNTQNIITAHVCKIPPDLDAGLSLIGRLRRDDVEAAEKATEHICFLADVNKLYDNALGLYDLDLALLVAQQSQKDPREYLPFLQSLQEMAELRRRFSIDNGLGRYSKALKQLFESDAFEELKTYTSQHQLYSESLYHYRHQPGKLNDIMRMYADHLVARSKFREGALGYESISSFPEAMKAYQSAGCWREALSCASRIPLTPPQLSGLAASLAETLYESKSYVDAAAIYVDYLRDVEAATRVLCKGYHFSEAVRILGLHSRNDLLPSILDQGLTEGLSTTTELLADCRDQLNAQIPRLRLLRAKKEEDPLTFYDGPTTESSIPDNISLAGTTASTTGGASLCTRYTGVTGATGTLNTQTSRRTSKNRRKEERKRAMGKKGSVYEEDYLVNSIERLIKRVESVRKDVENLLEACLKRGMRERAMALQKAMEDVVEMCRNCAIEVFAGDDQENGETANSKQVRCSGAAGVLQQTLESKGKRREVPVVEVFEKLSLLGG